MSEKGISTDFATHIAVIQQAISELLVEKGVFTKEELKKKYGDLLADFEEFSKKKEESKK